MLKSQPKILLIEDDTNLNFILTKSLERAGFSVITENTGAAGLSQALDKKVDLILLDIGLPELNGFEVIKKLRPQKLSVPIIVMTSQSQLGKEIESYELGANLFHRKPINYELLEAQIKSMLAPKISEADIKIKDLVISPAKMTVSRKGKGISLTKSEFDLLFLLVTSNGRVFSRNDISKRVMKSHMDVEPGAVDTLVSRLRKKLNVADGPEIIDTVHKSGYRVGSAYFVS